MSLVVTFSLRGVKRAKAWMMAMRAISPIVGDERAKRWAESGIKRVVHWRLGSGPWERLYP